MTVQTRPNSELMIAGKKIEEIWSMNPQTRYQWCKTILPEEKEEVKKAIKEKPNGLLCRMCDSPLTGKQTVFCSDRKCRRKWQAEWKRKDRQKNPEKYREWDRKSYQKNREEILKRLREDYQKNPEKYREKDDKYYLNNREERLKRQREDRQKNPEKYREWDRKSYQKNREKDRERRGKNYRRSNGLPEDADLTETSVPEYKIERWSERMGLVFETQRRVSFKEVGGTHTRIDIYYPEAKVPFYVDGYYDHYVRLDKNGKTAHETRDADQNKYLPMLGYKKPIRLTDIEVLAGERPWEVLEMHGIPLPPEFEQQTLEEKQEGKNARKQTSSTSI